MSSEVKYALLVPLVAQLDKSDDVAQFLHVGHQLVNDEPETIHWFALKYNDTNPPTYAIFDTFTTEGGRTAHLTGKVAAALMENAPTLLSPPPQIAYANLIASRLGALSTGVTVGTRTILEAKPGKAQAVRDFLTGTLAVAQQESSLWYAMEFPETNKFALVDLFPDNQARDTHLNGKIPAALSASSDELFVDSPDVVHVDVLAAKV